MSSTSQVLETSLLRNLRKKIPQKTLTSSFSISNESQSHSLSELLPYDPKTKGGDRLLAGLKEFDFLLTAAEKAAESLKGGHVSKFDPLVGENACQIRALKNCLIFSKHPVDENDFLSKIQSRKNKIDSLIREISSSNNTNATLHDILVSNGIDLQLTYREIYLIKSYLLTFVKTIKPPKENLPFVKNEYTDTKKLKTIKPIGTMFAENLIKKLRESLSAFSVSFIQEISSQIAPDPLNEALIDQFYIRHNRLHCLPCYWVTKLLMIQALESEVPLIIIARQLAKDKNYETLRELPLSFRPTISGYEPTSLHSFDLQGPSLVLLVNSCRESTEFPDEEVWKEELLQHNPIDLILAYAASHRQYPDASKDELMDQLSDEQYKFYKEKASEWGCSIENPSGFFLSHAFCERIENISNHLDMEKELVGMQNPEGLRN